jgi:FAD/FMN-containing dehydrogenase
MAISRRSFLRTTGVGMTAAALAACSAQTGTPTTPTTTTLPATTATAPVQMNYTALAGRLNGHLLTPDSPGYDLARRSYNPLFDGRRPAAVAQCATVSDVQACVEMAAATRTSIAARGGGHSYAGYSTPDNALVVDLARMAGVQVDGDTAVIGAGARLIDVYAALAGAGRCLPAGSCPSVGIAGLTLGGGIGVLARKFGLTCDSLTSAMVVTADGQARTVSASNDADLFWALRGGGGGNFGIVTSFTFRTVPAPQLTVFSFGYHAVADAFAAWQPWIAGAPDELWANFNVTGGNPPTCTITGCYVGTAAGVRPLLADLTGKIGATPTYHTQQTLGYLDAMRYFASCSNKSMATCQAQAQVAQWNRESFAASSRMLTAPLHDPGTIVTAATGHPNLHLIIDGLGGAVGRVAAADTAFPHRSAVASMQIYLKTTAAAASGAAQQVHAVRDELAPATGGTGYVNYIDATMPNWAQAYYGANLPRLRTVAQTYDPNQAFTFAQAINRAG